MRAFSNLTPWDRFALVHVVTSFYKGSDRPESTAEELAKLKEEYRFGEKPIERETISIEKAMQLIAEEAEKNSRNGG